MRCSDVWGSAAMDTDPLSRADAPFLAHARARPRPRRPRVDAPRRLLLGRAADAEEDDRGLVGDVSDLVLDVHQQPVAPGPELARVQPAVELQRVRAGVDARVEARADRLVAALDQH